MATNVHEESKNIARHALAGINICNSIGAGLALAAGDDTVAELRVKLNVAGASEQELNLIRHAQQCLDRAKDAGCITDADMVTVAAGASPAARLALLQAVFTAIDSTLAATHSRVLPAHP